MGRRMNENYYGFWGLTLNQYFKRDKRLNPRVCAIKNYRFVIYGIWTDFVVSKHFFYCKSLVLARTNTLAYYGIRKLRVRNVL